MPEKRLLLLPPKVGAFTQSRYYTYALGVVGCVGAVVVLFGAWDMLNRLNASLNLPHEYAQTAFAPAAVLDLPGMFVPQANPVPTAAATSSEPLEPARLTIPAIGVSAKIEQVGKNSDGSMQTPSTFYTVGWYKLGAKPGEPGNAVIDGHVNNALTTAGVFEHLGSLKLGDTITVADASGRSLTYAVSNIEQYAVDSAPVADIFATSGPSQLVLITCDGQWDPAARSYANRLVVFAKLLQ